MTRTRSGPPVPVPGGWVAVGQPPPMPPPLPVAKPPAVTWATVLCYIGVGVAAWGLLLSTGYVVEPMDGVTRSEAATATVGLVAALALLLVAGHGLRKSRPGGGWAFLVVGAGGIVLGGYGTRYFVAAAVDVVAGRTVGAPIGLILFAAAPLLAVGCIVLLVAISLPKARRWFGANGA